MLKKSDLVTILSTGNKQIFKVAKALLDEAGFEYNISGNGNNMKNDDSSNNQVSKSTIIEIQVSSDTVPKARSLLADLEELDFVDMK